MARLLRSWQSPKMARRKKLPRQLPPKLVEKAYFDALRAIVVAPIVKILDDVVKRLVYRVEQARADADDPIDPGVFKTVRAAAQRMTELWRPTEVENAARKYAERADDWNKEQLGKQVRAAAGVPLSAVERPTQNRVPAFVQENVALIKTVPERAMERVEKLVAEAASSGMRPETLAQKLLEIGDIAENDARRIARDQIGKLVANINEDRQRALGADTYVWRGVMDNRERDEHREREGQVFRWDDPPEDGHPGEAIQCRCWAELNLDLGGLED